MADPLTELPPPSRFDPDELNSFYNEPALPDLPPPTILWSPSVRKQLKAGKLCTDVLVVALSNAGRRVVHSILQKELVGSVMQAGIPLVGNSIEGGIQDKACYIYCTSGGVSSLWVSVQYTVPTEHASTWTKCLFAAISGKRVLVLGDVPHEHFRGRLSADQELVFMLETDKQLEDCAKSAVAPYFPSGSLVDGLPAALLTYCQMRNNNGSLLVTAPQSYSAVRLAASVAELLQRAQPGHVPAWDLSAAHKKRHAELTSEIYV